MLNKNIFIKTKDVIILVLFCAGIFLIGKILIGYIRVFFIWINQVASKMDAVVAVALITGSLSVLGVVISSIISKILEYRQNTKRYLYEKKEEPYSEFIEMVYKTQKFVKENKEYNEKEMLDDMFSFSKKLTLWGSSEVIKKWLTFREVSQNQTGDPTDNLFILEEIIFEIRNDMGQKRKGLKKGDILSFFVNDIKEYLPKDKAK
ncbi:hypothetical protein LW893_04405 [Parvimonas micra]|uniref:hypothetical protein n=1 Tax=Parvimonas micra TaxID=33033 RepID=UPI001E35F4F9|nr:hypothetical protein [Parvimonas micra]MCE3020178.1 hypothetical protein [Parvimonas micra]